ncbi:hypothetical protein LS482_12110 [Sinomicrobium kalidii]|uniref:hypothetical protein n=1 Tax=Sinomicrobium kalidii TaxID=2900738 RepID=UPI001E435F27|nr:hypothetical protein [Sinomicrobium kalidii]UGU14445.1 hypothetical protein LS482_12110 [Sinomicrobium kalidii]
MMKKKANNKRLDLKKFTVAKLNDPNIIFGGADDGPDTPPPTSIPKELKPTKK